MTRFTLGLLLVVSSAACHSAAVRPASVVTAPAARPAAVAKAAPAPAIQMATADVKAVAVVADSGETVPAKTEVAADSTSSRRHHGHHRIARSGQRSRHESRNRAVAVVEHKAVRTLEERELTPTPQPTETTLTETVASTMNKDSLNQFVHERIHSIQSCYEKELRLHTNLHGGIAVQFDVTPSGQVRHSRVEKDTVHDSAVSSCVVRHINEWVTPFKPTSTVRVSFPFVFGATEFASR